MSQPTKTPSLRWIYSTAINIAKKIPGLTATIIIFTLSAQISLLAASFLPLKAIILIGSPGIPSYFPGYLKSFERESLFVGLCLTAVAFYALYMASEYLTKHLTLRGSENLVRNTSKLIVFDGQDDVARRAYSRFTRSLAALVFLILTLAALGVIYIELLLAVIAFWGGVALYAKLTHSAAANDLSTIESTLERVNSLGSIGFLAAFAYLAVDLLSSEPPALLPAIIGVLLTRQIMQRATQLIQDILLLKEQRLQISALFFSEHTLINNSTDRSTKFLNLFAADRVHEWASTILDNRDGQTYVQHSFTWHQTGVHDVFGIESSSRRQTGEIDNYLLKVYNSNRVTLAVNEATLLSEPNINSLPSLELIKVTLIDGYHCHLYRTGKLNKIPAVELGLYQKAAVKLLMQCVPPVELVEKFSRSRPFLWDRLSDETLHAFGKALAMTPQNMEFINFSRKIKIIRCHLKSLPVYINNSAMGADQLYLDVEDSIIVGHWGNWSIEPVGAGLELKNILNDLPDLLIKLKSRRIDMSGICTAKLHLAGLCYQLDQLLVRQRFITAAGLLPEISAIVSSFSQHPENSKCSA